GIFSSLNNPNPKMKPIRYDEFITALEQGKVENATYQPLQLVYEVKGEMTDYEKGETFVTNIPENDMDGIREIVAKTNTEIDILPPKETSAWVSFFTGLVPFIIIIIL